MKRIMAIATFGLLVHAPMSHAVETNITVRVISRDAKVMGKKVGGARVTIRESKTGKLLDKGLHMGGTGDTKTIMVEPHARNAEVYSAGESGSYVARLDIDEPTWVDIVAEGPLGYEQSTARASKTLLLLPGRHVEGEGVLLEIHGFNVELQSPVEFKSGEPITVRTKLTMT